MVSNAFIKLQLYLTNKLLELVIKTPLSLLLSTKRDYPYQTVTD